MRRVVFTLSQLVPAIAVAFGVCAAASPGAERIKWVTARHISSIDGPEVYDAYCAVCHGKAGRGDGPAAKHLTVAVPDLTRICERDRAFNALHVSQHVISGAKPRVAMANWPQVFRDNYSSESFAHLAMFNVVRHVESLQAASATRATR
ncbi:MAG: c-type cytochrome [Acidobacteria bacterium]|nr:c-type cytochrome [Acidobacteriota bacterium]